MDPRRIPERVGAAHLPNQVTNLALYRLWPRFLKAMVLVKPATVIQWHRQAAKSLYPFVPCVPDFVP